MASTNPARGMRDFLPADVRKREYVIGVIKRVYESYGFEPLETPAVENIETLMGKYGEEGNQLVFRVMLRGEKLDKLWAKVIERPVSAGSGNMVYAAPPPNPFVNLADLALRYDLTVPLARVVANHKNELPKFFKRYQIQPVWRADRPARGRFREFFQCDVDVIGSRSTVVEVELIAAVVEILKRLGFGHFYVRINHRGILAALLRSKNVPDDQVANALIALDKLDKVGPEGVRAEFDKHRILHTPQVQAMRNELIDIFMSAFDVQRRPDVQARGYLTDKDIKIISDLVLAKVTSAIGDDVEGGAAIKDIQFILGNSAGNIGFEPSLARGLSYYTGTIMEINVPDLGGSLGGGGRYDGLIGMFGKEQIPACGFSLGLERILVVMDERGMFPPEIADSTPADVMVTIWSDNTAADSLKLANELRASGLRVTVYPEADKLGKQMKYADAINVPWVCVLGENEITEGSVTVKDMKTGEQRRVMRDAVSELLG